MVEERIAFEKEYLSFKDLEPIEEKLKECARAEQKLTLDFSKVKGAAGDFLTAAALTYLNELEKQGKEIEALKEKIILIFESETCSAYKNFTMMGMDLLVGIQFKNETYKNKSENQ